jgi:hypothetical protein
MGSRQPIAGNGQKQNESHTMTTSFGTRSGDEVLAKNLLAFLAPLEIECNSTPGFSVL